MPKKDAPELLAPDVSTSAPAMDPDAVSSVKLLAVVFTGGALYGAYRFAELKLGKERVEAYQRVARKKLAQAYGDVHARTSAVVAQAQGTASSHLTAAHSAGVALAAAAYAKSGAKPVLAAAQGATLRQLSSYAQGICF